MKTYIYYYKENNKTFSVNYKANDINEALDIAIATGYELKGEKVSEIKMTDVFQLMANVFNPLK